MQQFSHQEIAEIRTRIDQIHDLLAAGGGAATALAPVAPVAHVAAPDTALIRQVSFNIQMRRMRKAHFGAQLSGPIWDMMLDLVLADTHRRALGASDLATGAGVPLSSGLRLIATLEQLGLARRSTDESDRRRSIVRLTDGGKEKMATYFDAIALAWQNRHSRAM